MKRHYADGIKHDTAKRHFADGKKVLFIASMTGRTEVVATAITTEWATRIAEALNATDAR